MSSCLRWDPIEAERDSLGRLEVGIERAVVEDENVDVDEDVGVGLEDEDEDE